GHDKSRTAQRAPNMGGSLSCSRVDSVRSRCQTAGTRLVRLVHVAFAAIAIPLSGAAAQQPGRAITIIVPYTPASGPDILARTLGEELQQRWGQPVVIENKPGASGNIGTQVVARAAADGHTLMLTTSPFTQNIS